MSLRRKLLILLPFAVALVIGGCKVSSINYFPPHPANVRVVNLMSETPGIDVQIQGQPAFAGVKFQAVTGYQSYDNTSTSFAVTVTGSGTSILNFTYNLAGEQPYTLVLFGTLTNPAASLLQEVAKAPTNGNIQLATFNAAVNTTAVDIYVTAPGVDITTINPNYGSVGYNGTTFNLAFAPGTYQIRVTSAGTKTVIYDSGGTALTPNIALTLVNYSTGSGILVNGLVLQSQAGSTPLDSVLSRIKPFNGASGVGSVDQLMGNVAIASGIPYANAAVYSVVPDGPTTVNFQASATPGAVIASVAATLPPGGDVSTFVTGLPGSQQAFVLNDLNLPPFSGDVRLRFVNTSWNSNPLNFAVNGVTVASNVAFPTASGYVQIAAAPATITATDTVTGSVVMQIDGVTLTASQTSTVYVLGPLGAQAGIITQDN